MPGRILAIFALPAVAVLLIFVVLGFVVWWPFYLIAPLAAAATVWFFWYRSDEAILRALDARQLGQTEGQRVLNTVENLCLTSGIDQPEVMVVDTEACNVAVVSGRLDTLVVTTGLLQTLDVMETEGVIAHALTKLSSGAVRYETLAASAQPFITSAQQDLARRWGTGDAGVTAFDISGVGLTRYPPGLRSALEQIDGRSTDIPGGDALGSALLVPPQGQRVPLDHRIEVLWEL
jgi:Zn-dependent protease with chaperone function